MNENKNQQQQTEGVGDQNPTLNNPETKIAGFSNPLAGTATENSSQNKQQDSNPQRGNADESQENNETIGNP